MHLVGLTFSKKGSNDTVIRLTPLRFISLTCFPIAETIPAERRKVPLNRTDMVITLELFFGNRTDRRLTAWVS